MSEAPQMTPKIDSKWNRSRLKGLLRGYPGGADTRGICDMYVNNLCARATRFYDAVFDQRTPQIKSPRLISAMLQYGSAIALIVCVPGLAVAQTPFKYTYVEAAYMIGDFELAADDVDIKGYKLTAQFVLSPSFVVGVDYASIEGEDTLTSPAGVQTISVDSSGPNAYFLYHTPMGLQTDFLLGARRNMSDFNASVVGEAPFVSQSEDVNFLFTGLRHWLNGIELRAEWFYNLDAADNEDEWSYTLGLLSGPPTGLQLGFEITPDSDGDLMGISIRQSY